MALPPGTCLGRYEVQAALGAGGMGEVYRARDTKLRRDVAIKVLSSTPTPNRDGPSCLEERLLHEVQRVVGVRGKAPCQTIQAFVMRIEERGQPFGRITRQRDGRTLAIGSPFISHETADGTLVLVCGENASTLTLGRGANLLESRSASLAELFRAA
jgi:serine/threonine protein kinase